eukprot:217112_1
MTIRILDGSMGLYLIHTGVPKSTKIWSAAALIDPKYHINVINAHKEYLQCGSNIITTNNYACIPGYLSQIGMENEIESLTELAVSLAHQAREEFIIENKRYSKSDIKIAGCIPPLMESYRPDLRLSEQLSLKYYSKIVKSLQKGKSIDIFLIETMGCLDTALYALRAIACNNQNNNNEIFVSFSLNNNGNLRSNENINYVIEKLEIWMKHLNISIISMNCCTPESIENAFHNLNSKSLTILQKYNVFMGAYPNGTVEIKTDWTLKESGYNPIRQDLLPNILYSQFYKKWINKYYKTKRLRLLGGCCNIEPHHIKYFVSNAINDFNTLMPKPLTKSKL